MFKGAIRAIAIGVLGVAILVAVILSPFFIAAAGKHTSLDWNFLSAVGQSYGAASALLSGVALCVLAVSVRVQVQQTTVSQLQAARSMQLDLIRMAVEDPEYRAVLGEDLMSLGSSRWKEHTYLNLWIMYLQMAYLTGAFDDDGVRRALKGEFFNGVAGRRYWPVARVAFRAEASTRQHSRFLLLVEETYQDVCAESDSKEGEPNGEVGCRGSKPCPTSSLSQALGLVVAGVAVWHSVRRKI